MIYKNTLNLLQTRGGNYIKQTDRSSVVGYQLQDYRHKRITDLDGKKAYITLSDRTSDRFFKQKSVVDCDTVNFILDGNMDSGVYDVEIEIDGHVFPSDDKVWLNISKSNTATKFVTPEGFDLSEFLTSDRADTRYAKKEHTHVLDDIVDQDMITDTDILNLFI